MLIQRDTPPKKAALLHPDKVCAAGACKTKEEQDAVTKKFHAIAEVL
jgi:hypothetical protein